MKSKAVDEPTKFEKITLVMIMVILNMYNKFLQGMENLLFFKLKFLPLSNKFKFLSAIKKLNGIFLILV